VVKSPLGLSGLLEVSRGDLAVANLHFSFPFYAFCTRKRCPPSRS
jgi:hypothetical protein